MVVLWQANEAQFTFYVSDRSAAWTLGNYHGEFPVEVGSGLGYGWLVRCAAVNELDADLAAFGNTRQHGRLGSCVKALKHGRRLGRDTAAC